MNKIAVLGPRGRLGSALVQMGAAPIETDLFDTEGLRELNRYPVVVNCAAVTDVDGCQNREANVQTPTYQKAVAVNCRALEGLRRVYRHRLIHISSDYVFKGDHGPYAEDAKRNPVNDYGYTKLGGEVVLETHPDMGETAVVRTTGLFGNGKDFASYAQTCWKRNEEIIASDDLRGNQTYIPHLARALMQLAQMTWPEDFFYLHIASSDICSRYEFAVMLAEQMGYPTEMAQAVKSKQIANWIAPRPTYGGLKVAKARHLGLPLYSIMQGIQEYCA